MNKFTNILILSAGRRVELVESFKTALKQYIPNAQVFTADISPELSAACHSSDAYFKVPRVTSSDYIDKLIDVCKNNHIGLVIPTIDTELQVLADNQKSFKNESINLIISNPELISACRDKRKTVSVYKALDIDQPKIFDRKNIQFPCFCKPYDGSSGIGAYPIHTPEMLTKELLDNEKNMFMELVGSEYSEYTVDVYYDKQGELRCLVPRQRIEVRGGEVSKGMTRKNFVYDYLLPRLNKLTNGRGCVTVQVFANSSNKSIKALEINPRFGGGFPLSQAAGADYTDWLIREYLLNESIDFYDSWEDNLLMLRYDAKVLVHA